MVEGLVKLDTANGVLSPEQASTWRTNLAQLISQGATALPAIREFLDKNLDIEFGGAGKQMLGYSSARLAMIDPVIVPRHGYGSGSPASCSISLKSSG